VPFTAFIERLLGPNSGQSFLHEYFVGHVTFWILEGLNEYHVYKKLFEACNGKLGQQVAPKLTD
jgi:hypothetical protein